MKGYDFSDAHRRFVNYIESPLKKLTGSFEDVIRTTVLKEDVSYGDTSKFVCECLFVLRGYLFVFSCF